MASRGMRRLERSLGVSVLLAPSPSTEAQEQPVTIAWQAPAECPDGDAVRSEVERILRRPLGREDPRLSIRGSLRERTDGVWQADLWIEDAAGAGTRVLEGDDCVEVSDAAAFVIAVMIDPDAQLPPDKPEPLVADPIDPSRLRARHPGLVRSATRAPTQPATRPRRDPLRFALRADAAVGVGPLPTVAPGVHGAFALLWPRARFELGTTYWFSRSAHDEAGAGGDIRLLAFSARGCWTPRVRTVEFPLCGGIEAGSMHGRGVGIDEPTSVRLPWVAVTAGPALAWVPVRRVAVWLGTDLVVPVVRPDFAVEGLGRVHRAAPAAFAGMIGVEARFP